MLVDLNQILPIETLDFKISISVESYDEKTAENYQNCYVAENRIISKQSEISISNFDGIN